MTSFHTRLRDLRNKSGATIKDFAARLRLSESYIEKLEHGYCAPPAAITIVDMARALRVDADELCALAGKVAPDVLTLLHRSPLLVQLVRLGASWESSQLCDFLAAQGVPNERLNFTAPDMAPKDSERFCIRELVTAELKRAVFHLDGNECVYCSAVTLLEVDHICPVSLGGTNDLENLVTCCNRCNTKKKNRATPFVMPFGRFRSEVEG